MKLCDRCPQAGSCLLNYLGKACHKLRMQECPEVVPTTLELMHNMDAEELAAFLSKTFCQSLGKRNFWNGSIRRCPMKRSEILEAARRCVCGEREQDYGTPENNFETIGLLWGVYLRAAHPEYAKVMPINGITAKDAGTMLALLKVARIATGSSPDSFIDLAGYAACAGEIVTERSCPYEKAETQTQE